MKSETQIYQFDWLSADTLSEWLDNFLLMDFLISLNDPNCNRKGKVSRAKRYSAKPLHEFQH